MGKAFLVSAPDGENSAIIFAGSNIEARKWGAHEWNGGELGGMRCSRVHGFDRFVGIDIPASEMIRMGWWFECSNCGGRIDDDDSEERGVVPDDVIGTQRQCEIHQAQGDAFHHTHHRLTLIQAAVASSHAQNAAIASAVIVAARASRASAAKTPSARVSGMVIPLPLPV